MHQLDLARALLDISLPAILPLGIDFHTPSALPWALMIEEKIYRSAELEL